MIEIGGKMYLAETVTGFEFYNGLDAKIVSGVNTPSGNAVAIRVYGAWQFVNPRLNAIA